MQVVHLFPREPKFFFGAQQYFSASVHPQTWLVRCPPQSLGEFPPLNQNHSVSRYEGRQSIPANTEVLFIHYLDLEMANLLIDLPSSVQTYIQTWGGDMEPLYPSHKLYDRQTFEWLYQKSRAHSIPVRIGAKLYEVNRKWQHRHWIKALRKSMKTASRVSFGMGRTEAQHLKIDASISPYCIDYYLPGSDVHSTKGNPRSILLGNSCNPTNNHLDALQVLKNCSMEIEEIILPLSYGDEEYRDWLIPKATQLFGRRIKPIIDFVSIDAYHALISRCGIAFMNHKRQQALGSIKWAFSSRKQVVLNPGGIGFSFFASDPKIVHSSSRIADCIANPVAYDDKALRSIETKFKNHKIQPDTVESDICQFLPSA